MRGAPTRVARLATLLLSTIPLFATARVQADPGSIQAKANKAYVLGDFPRAIALFLRAKELAGCEAKRSKRCAKLEIQLGLARASAGKLEGARLAFKRALRHDPASRLDADRDNPDHVALFEQVRAEVAASLPATTKPVSSPKPLLAPPPPTTRPAPVVAAAAAPPRRRGRLWTYVAAASAIAATAVGVGLSLSASSDAADACDLLVDTGSCDQRTHLARTSDRPRYDELQQRSETKTTWATVAWVAAGTLAAGAIVLYWLEGRRGDPPSREKKAAWSLSPFGVVLSY